MGAYAFVDETKLRQVVRECLRESVMDLETVFMVPRSGIERPWLRQVILDELHFLVAELDGVPGRQQDDELVLDLPGRSWVRRNGEHEPK